ncbi:MULTISPECIES: TetR/AcrR family transcriptional regulator [Pandoraea]|uniref:TetR/AcrR family transcriptional regulator n=1 Tax=Pandoraea TaxID=93217 RepID=UPI001F5DC857|nr:MULTISPECIES: TetR/AcrR family transcriptional regulator [Pandoraea]MCI3206028.1 TetR/AcrR family transcriptional regulator [Pandoraea sp. LA3]MDN4584056.1 TetR/AcrR family transcriptional regulator [Pandoraea capi]
MNPTHDSPAQSSPRDRILVAAHDLFYRDGVRATGIDKIIEQSKVAKVTFYRQYPSKDDLIRAYLDYRHVRWIHWFRTTLDAQVATGQSPADALVATLAQWFSRDDFRGCAFLNSSAELGTADPQILEIVREHKDDMTSAIETLVAPGNTRAAKARALALAVDGAIVHVQMGHPLPLVLDSLRTLISPMFAK